MSARRGKGSQCDEAACKRTMSADHERTLSLRESERVGQSSIISVVDSIVN